MLNLHSMFSSVKFLVKKEETEAVKHSEWGRVLLGRFV